MKSKQTSREAAESSLQTLLGTCKHNPLFLIQRDQAAKCILLFYGAELLETFPDCPDHFALRLCAGRLYNAGLKRSSLSEAFRMDIRTISRVAQSLCQPDPDALFEVLQGRQRPRKLTPAIRSFLREMMDMAFSLHPEAPSRFLREMVLKVYNVSLSAETIRPLLAAYRKEVKARETADTQTSCDPPEKPTGGTTEDIQAHDVTNKQLNGFEPCSDPLESPEPDRKRSAYFSPSCHPRSLPHAGLFVFLPMLEALAGVDREDGALLRQWAAGVLLGAVNLEQTKTLDYASMETFLGPIRWKSPSPLRRELQRVSSRKELRSSLLAFNARLTGHTAPTHVYFDPHTKLYTGKHPVLFGWISSAKRVDKAHHGDWFHGPDGFPLWHQLCDNYEDMRARFVPAFRQMRRDLSLPLDLPLCVVVDRGIHGSESFDAIREEPGLSVLTWDQTYRAGDATPPEEGVFAFNLIRRRNHSLDLVVIEVEAWETPHPQVPGATRVVFKTTSTDKGEHKEAAIVNIGADINARVAVERMTSRWLQENDYKYQMDHFGMNELTSYATRSYAELVEELQDRPVPNAVRKALVVQTAELRTELGKVLVAARKGKKEATKVMEALKTINKDLQVAETSKAFHALRKQADQALKRFDRIFSRTQEKQRQADEIDRKLSGIRRQIKKLPSEVSRLETLIQAEKVRHDFVPKEFFDTIKMITRNMFCLRLRQFREHYDNLRDDHVLLRDFTRSPGILVEMSETELLLHPGFMSSRKKLQAAFDAFLEELTQEHEKNPYQNVRLVRSKDAIELAIKISQNPL